MSFAIGVIILVVSALVALLIWTSVGRDEVGWKPKQRRQLAGLQGRTTDWLYYEALLQAPDALRIQKEGVTAISAPSDRALNAVVAREAFARRIEGSQALARMRESHQHPLARAFLQGKMGAAMRVHWRGRYDGPDGLFVLWYYLIALPRYGRRHLFLDTLAAVLQEFRKA